MAEKVLITGGSGFVGSILTDLLVQKGYHVTILSRTLKTNTENVTYSQWDVARNQIDKQVVLQANYIVHLAGENIAGKRWTDSRKKAIVDSRVKSLALIHSVLSVNKNKVKALVSASGVGFYGALNTNTICFEDSPAGNDFLGHTCQEWEAAADAFSSLGIRTVKLRTGLVLGKNDGFLQKMTPIFQRGLGSVLGTGEQPMPWIHVFDLCSMYVAGIEKDLMTGAYNAAINDKTTNAIFSRKLAKFYNYTLWLPRVPGFFLKLVLGKMAVIVLSGNRVSSNKIQEIGFEFQFKKLSLALKDCLSKSN